MDDPEISFGRTALDLWHLDPAFAYLNHGTVGATPRYVLDRQRAWSERIERHPAEFMLRQLANPMATEWPLDDPPLMRQAAIATADFVGADADGLGLVDNITTGANAVLRSLDLGPGDVVAVCNLGYGGVSNAVRYVAERAGAKVDVIELPNPGASADVVAAAFDRQLRAGTRLAVIDHLTAFSALVLPVSRFIASCRSKGALVLVDGAHVPGQLELSISELGGPDFYTANLHKWAWTPRSSGFLWVAPEHRDWVHPSVVSWGLGRGLAAEFDLPGTRDPTPFLVIGEVLEFRSRLGGEAAIRGYNHRLCWESAQFLARHWDTPFTTPESMIGAMAVIPLPERLGSTVDDAERLRRFLSEERRVEVPIFAVGGDGGGTGPAGSSADPDPYGAGASPGLVVRICTQIYNDTSDIERLADAVDAA